MKKIVVAGIGGVGGYFGGLLARHYENSDKTSIYFFSRGENKAAIEKNGLRLETAKGNFNVRPAQVTGKAAEIGIVDYIIVSTKSYGLEKCLTDLKPCIDKETVILPLLNGVDSTEKIKTIYPENEVWEGCVYLVAKLIEPGFVKEAGGIAKLYFGAEKGSEKKLEALDAILKDAGIDSNLSPNIRQATWEKFLFISAIATLTSHLNTGIGTILSNAKNKKLLQGLLSELKTVADAEKIPLPENSIQSALDKMAKLPPETTSSMHADFQKGKQTELKSLTGYVIMLAQKHNIAVPTYTLLYEQLKMRFGNFFIRPLCMEDTVEFFNMVEENRERLKMYFAGTVAATQTLEDTKTHLEAIIPTAEKRTHYPFAVVDAMRGKMIGAIALKNIDWNVPKAETGYFIDKDYEGKGITTRAVARLLDFGFDDLQLKKIYLRTHESNMPSRKIAENNGFKVEGVLQRDYKTTDGTLIDTTYYGLIR